MECKIKKLWNMSWYCGVMMITDRAEKRHKEDESAERQCAKRERTGKLG